MANTDGLLDFDDFQPQEQPGIKLDGVVYPWAHLGPVQTAKLAQFQEQIRELTTGEGDVTVEQAEEMVRLQRLQLQTVVPTMPHNVMETLEDARVETALSFFDVWRMNGMADEAEKRLEPAARMSASADQVEAMNQRMRRIGGRSSRDSNGSMVEIPVAG